MQEIGQKSQKKTDQKSNLKHAPIRSPCSMSPRGPSKSNTICIQKRDHSGSVPWSILIALIIVMIASTGTSEVGSNISISKLNTFDFSLVHTFMFHPTSLVPVERGHDNDQGDQNWSWSQSRTLSSWDLCCIRY